MFGRLTASTVSCASSGRAVESQPSAIFLKKNLEKGKKIGIFVVGGRDFCGWELLGRKFEIRGRIHGWRKDE